MLDISGDPMARVAAMTTKMMAGILPAPCPYYDLEVDEAAMEELEVGALPKMSSGNRLLLQTLLERYGYASSIRKSALTGLV